MDYYIYILKCVNGALYTGYTRDIKRRYQEHINGSAKCKYTRSFPPRYIAACWKAQVELSTVLKIEYAIKQLPKSKKISIINSPDTLIQTLHLSDDAINVNFVGRNELMHLHPGQIAG